MFTSPQQSATQFLLLMKWCAVQACFDDLKHDSSIALLVPIYTSTPMKMHICTSVWLNCRIIKVMGGWSSGQYFSNQTCATHIAFPMSRSRTCHLILWLATRRWVFLKVHRDQHHESVSVCILHSNVHSGRSSLHTLFS